jgi:hypothetical protein
MTELIFQTNPFTMLPTILSKIEFLFNNDEVTFSYFQFRMQNYMEKYYNTGLKSIINLYPIEFIHICFFKIFTEMFSYNDDTTIYNFNYIFIHFHKLQVHRYNNNLENLQKIMTIKMQTYMNSNMQVDDVDDIMEQMNQFSISS